MAGRRGLSRLNWRTAAVAAGIVALVLGLHGLGLEWLAARVGEPAPLRTLDDPMFTRVIQPAPAVPPPPIAPPVAAPGPVAAAKPQAVAPRPPRPPASAPEPPPPPRTPAEPPPEATAAAPEPDPLPQPAPPPVLAASAPVASASAPVADAPPGDGWPPDTRLTYKLGGQFRNGPLYGRARVQWQREGARYQVRVEVDITPFISIAMTSQGEVTPAALVPRVYEEMRNGRRRLVRLEDGQLVLGDGRSLPRPPEVQDTASQFVELGHRFATGRLVPVLGNRLDLPLARPGGLELWAYDIAGEELVRTAGLGEVAAWRLQPRPTERQRGGVNAEMWFAPTLQYLPVRIRLTLNDEAVVDLVLETVEQR